MYCTPQLLYTVLTCNCSGLNQYTVHNAYSNEMNIMHISISVQYKAVQYSTVWLTCEGRQQSDASLGAASTRSG